MDMEWLNGITINGEAIREILMSLLIIAAVWMARVLLLRLVVQHFGDPALQYQWRKISRYTAFILVLLLIGPSLIGGFQNTATYLGLLSAGLAVALQPLIVNLAAWLFILWRRPFRVGDRIQVGDHAGDVIDLRPFQFTLMEIGNWVDADQATGRVIHIPNGAIFDDTVANYTRGFHYIWNEIPVLVTFESNWQQAKTILNSIAQCHGGTLGEQASQRIHAASRRYYTLPTSFEPRVFTSVQDSGVLLTIRYLCDPRQRRDSSEALWEDILHAFAKRADIDFAYPTQRFYNNVLEGKEEARAAFDGQAQQA